MFKILVIGTIVASSYSFQLPSVKSFPNDQPNVAASQIHNSKEFRFDTNGVINDIPIIGVLTQPLSSSQLSNPAYANKTSYIMASYISALESAGARTVPIIFGGVEETELAKIDKLNGVFFCGGSGSPEYQAFGKKVFDKVKSLNDKGQYLPIWGTCLGF